MSRLSPSSELWEQKVSPFIRNREPNGGVEMDDSKKTMSRVTQLIEQLHANKSSPPERELITARLLGIVKSRKEGRSLIGSHSQAMPLFVSLLRNGTPIAKANVAATLSVLCKDDDLRLKVILGGCIPPLLTILKSETGEARKAAAEAVFKVTSSGLSDDPVGIRIFSTEGVVPALWQLLISDRNQDKVVEVFVTGSLRNLCTEKDGYWKTTLDAGGVDIVVKYLSADNPAAQSNAASLLARMVLASSECIPKIIGSGVMNTLLSFLEEKNDVSLRASAAEALNVISSKSPEAKKLITDAQGVALLIGAVVSPYKQGIEGEEADALQLHATRVLANISGGMPALLVYLGELSQSSRLSAPVPDILGALAYALKVFERSPEAEQFDAKKIENFLMLLLKPRDNKLVQERLLQAMINLYGNAYLSKLINQSKTKRVLTGLILMAVADVKEYLILSMMRLCNQGMDIWESIRMREGVQLLISLLGLSSEQQQEYAVEMLAMLTDQVEDSKWAITAAGGIPPLVHLLDNGTLKAREYAAHALEILCSHSEDIRACVENADAIPSFLWLLKNGGPKGQETSASALKKLIRVGDAPTINQLSAMLQGDLPSSKTHIIPVLGHVLAMASSNDLVEEGAAANKGFRSLLQVLNSSNESTKECAAFTLSDLFSAREDICDSLATEEVVNQCMKLLANDTPAAASHSARALGALSRLNKRMSTRKMSYADGDIKHLIRMAKTAPIVSAETAMAAMANLLSDPELATEALYEDVASALTRVLGEGSIEGKRNATRSLHQLLKYFPIPDILKGPAQRRFVVLGVAESLKAMAMDGNDASNALDIITLLAKIKEGANTTNATFSALAKVPSSSEPLVQCLSEGSPVVQDKAIEILSRLCMEQPAMLSGLLISKARSVAALAERIINSSLEVRIGGTALLICAARDYRHQSMDSLDASGYLKPLVFALVGMMKHKSKYSSLEIEVKTPRGYAGNAAFQEGDELKVSDSVTVSGSTLAMWLLSIISSFHAKSKVTIVEAGGLDILADRLAKHTANQQEGFEDSEGLWISTLLLALLFQDPNVVSSPTTIRFVPTIALPLKSEEVFNQFFAAQALSSLVSHRNEGINLAVSNSDAIGGLMTLIGHTETDIPNLFALFIEFSLVTIPDQVVLQCLFEIEDVRAGSIARKTIPLLVDLLKPMPNKCSAPPFAVRLLTQIADGNDTNKLIMAEAGVLNGLNKYLCLNPHDLTEATISELLRVLFGNHNLLKYEAATSCMINLVGVVRLGSRSARLSAISALNELFDAENIRACEASMQAVQPLVEVLESASESEQHATISTLIKLTSDSNPRAMLMTNSELNPLEILYKILTSSSSLELKSDAAKLCFIIFSDPKSRTVPIASQCMEPLISLIQSGYEIAVESGICAFERLLDEEQQVELASTFDLVDLLVEAGVIDALIDLLRSHQCEEPSGKLLEALFNKDRVREMKVSKYAIAPLAQYLLDPQTRSQPGTFLATLALGDLSRHEGLARASDSAFACRALIRVLTHHRTEEVCIVVISALQNFILRSRNNRRAVADAGGILAIQELLLSPNTELVLQSAILLRCLFSNHTLQDCVSNELIKSLTAVLEKQDSLPTPVIEEILRTFLVVFSTFPKLHASEAATLSIPHIVAGLISGSSATQELVLAPLMLLKQSWPSMPVDMSKAQATAASEAIPALQTLLKNCPPALHDKLESLLHCLPGCLTVTIKRASSLKSVMGGTNAFCRLKVGNGPARQTKVVHSTSPEWNEVFTWAFDVPPTDQKLYILCRSKNTFGKTTLGRVSIQIDKIVGEGTYSEVFTLSSDTSKDGSARTLEVEVAWSNNRTSNEGE
nr:protein CELLULOSE SYNTHASE INTERACTIVE 3-like isoform X1 [Ipomoea batatas]